jgi:hypothetical protein
VLAPPPVAHAGAQLFASTLLTKPEAWTPQEKPLALVEVPEFLPGGARGHKKTPNAEYAAVRQALLASAGGYRCAIKKLERVQNEDQWQRYSLLRAQWQRSGLPDHPNERLGVWHGTGAPAKEKIVRNGFNRSFNTAAVHGRGVYFARYVCLPSSLSFEFSRFRWLYIAHWRLDTVLGHLDPT